MADSKSFLACFLDDAIIVDAEQECHGILAIKAWSDREVLNDSVTIEIRAVPQHYDDYLVVTEVEGSFDKTNLPGPFLITIHFTLRSHRMATIICQQMKAAGTLFAYARAANASKATA